MSRSGGNSTLTDDASQCTQDTFHGCGCLWKGVEDVRDLEEEGSVRFPILPKKEVALASEPKSNGERVQISFSGAIIRYTRSDFFITGGFFACVAGSGLGVSVLMS